MSSLESENILFTIPDPSVLQPRVSIISVPNGVFDTITATTMAIGSLTIASINVTGDIVNTQGTTITTQDSSLSAQTVNAVTVSAYTFAIPNNNVITITSVVSGITAAGDTLSIKGSIRAKNILATGSIGGMFDYYFNCDAALVGASMSFSIVGTSVIVSVTGVAAQTIRFSGVSTIVQTTFS